MIVKFWVTGDDGGRWINTLHNVHHVDRVGSYLILHYPDSSLTIPCTELVEIHLEEVYEAVTEAH